MTTETRHRPRGRLAIVAALLVAIAACFGGLAGSAPGQSLTTVTVNTLPIANALPMDLGIQKGFFRDRGIEIKKVVLQSGNDIVLAMANSSGDVGYIGYVPAMIGRTQGSTIMIIAASEVEGTIGGRQLAEHPRQGLELDPDAGGPRRQDGRPERTQGRRRGRREGRSARSGASTRTDVKFVAMPFPTMRSALANGQVDAVWTPEPFMSLILGDGGRIVMAPGPVLGRFFPTAATSPATTG